MDTKTREFGINMLANVLQQIEDYSVETHGNTDEAIDMALRLKELLSASILMEATERHIAIESQKDYIHKFCDNIKLNVMRFCGYKNNEEDDVGSK
jgi:hypothetical protein